MADIRGTIHSSHMTTDSEGWPIPGCTCGWMCGAVPDMETAIDVLIDHVAETAFVAGYERGRVDEREAPPF